MARPSYTFRVASVCNYKNFDNGQNENFGVSDGLYSTEASTGTGRRRKPTGWVDPTAYSLQYRSYRRAQGTTRTYNPRFPNGGNLYSGCVGGIRFNSLNHFDAVLGEGFITDPSLANASKIAARIKMKRSDVNLGIAFAERNMTARLLGDTSKRIAKAFRNLRSGRVRAAMRDLGIANSRHEPRGGNVPNKWLELQYGWKPLVSDVYGACEALSKADRRDWRVTAKAQRNANRTDTRVVSSNIDLEDACVVGVQVEDGAFTRIDALPANDLIISLASLGITNPLLIAWELVPFSFVVDWSFQVGAWLESIDALLGYGNVTFSTSTFTKAVWQENGIRTRNPSTGWIIDNRFQGSKTVIRMMRSLDGSVLSTFPRIKDPRSLGHMANGLALLAQAFGRR